MANTQARSTLQFTVCEVIVIVIVVQNLATARCERDLCQTFSRQGHPLKAPEKEHECFFVRRCQDEDHSV
jgi:hypothetical protein